MLSALGFTRVFDREIASAVRTLRSRRPLENRTHESRKKLKELRAVLRLVRRHVGEARYGRENRALRDVARGLAGVRDAQVIRQTLHDLLVSRPIAGAEALVAYVVAHEKRTITRALAKANAIGRAVTELARIRGRLKTLPLGDMPVKSLRRALGKTFRQNQAGREHAFRELSDDAFHEWRKRVKHLRHQLELIEAKRPRVVRPVVNDLKRLSDVLGLDHDLAVLRDMLLRSPERAKPAVAMLSRAVATRQRRLRTEARALAKKLFTASAGDFLQRVWPEA